MDKLNEQNVTKEERKITINMEKKCIKYFR